MSPQTSTPFRARQSGSTIVTGLTIMALATLGITAWIALLGARSNHIEGMGTAVQRRVALMNAKAAAREYLYRNALAKTSGAATVITLPDGSGTVTVPALPLQTFTSVTRPGGVVRTGPANGYGYYVELACDIALTIDDDGDAGTPTINSSHIYDYQFKSRSPILAGDLITMYKPALTPAVGVDLKGEIRAAGNVNLWAAESPHSVNNRPWAQTYSTYTAPDPTAPAKVKDLSGNWRAQRDFVSVPTTTGDFGLANGFEGTLNYIDPVSNPPWSLKNQIEGGSYIAIDGATAFDSGRGAVSDGNGKVEITLDDIHLPNVLVGNGTKDLVFYGQDNDTDFNLAGSRIAIAVLVLQTSDTDDLRDIFFHDRNNRRLLLAMKKTGDWDEVQMKWEDAAGSPTWRLSIVSENARLKRRGQDDGVINMIGGIATDRDFDWQDDSNKILNIQRETDPKLLERLAPRTAWIESYAD